MKITKIKIVFYKSNYRWWSRLIKWWTNSNYSHCELYINDRYLLGISDEQQVRIKRYDLSSDKWDSIDLKIDDKLEWIVNDFFEQTQGAKYDWKAIILSNIFNRRKQDKTKYTCSEWISELLDLRYNIFQPKRYYMITPQDVYDVFRKMTSQNGRD